MDAPTDEQLLRDYLGGDIPSFEQLVRRHSRELHQFVMRFTGEAAAADDVVQETFVQVHHSAESFDFQRRLKPWLFTIGANKARDHLRRLNRRREVPFDAHIGKEDGGGQRFIDLMAGDDVLPDEELRSEEQQRIVKGVVDTMPESLSEVLILAYYHRFPYKEIAEIVGIPLGTVKSRLHAAVVHFGKRYQESVLSEETDPSQTPK